MPNLTIYAARGSNTTLTAYIRGVGQSDPLWGVDPGVGIYMDDVYIARPQGALLDVFFPGAVANKWRFDWSVMEVTPGALDGAPWARF